MNSNNYSPKPAAASAPLPMYYCSRAACREIVYKVDPLSNEFCPAHQQTPDNLIKKGRGGRVNRSVIAAANRRRGGGNNGNQDVDDTTTRSRTRKVMAESTKEHRHIQRLVNTNTNTQEEFDEFGNIRRRETQQTQQTHEAEDLRTVSERLVAEEKQEIAQSLKQFYQARHANAQQYPLLVTQEFHRLFEHCRRVTGESNNSGTTPTTPWEQFLAGSYPAIMEAQQIQEVLARPSLSYMEEHDTDGVLHCTILYLLFTATPQNRAMYEKLPLLFNVFHLNDDKVVLAQWHVPVGGGTSGSFSATAPTASTPTQYVAFSNKVPLVLLERYVSVRADFKAAVADYVAVHVADQQRQIDISEERAKGFAMQVTGSVSGGLDDEDHYDQHAMFM